MGTKRELLQDVLGEGVAYANGAWAYDVDEDWDGSDLTTYEGVTLTDDDGVVHTVTLADIDGAFEKIKTGADGADWHNSGYRVKNHGTTQSRIGLFYDTLGEDSDHDSIDSDAILQIAIFGKVIYG